MNTTASNEILSVVGNASVSTDLIVGSKMCLISDCTKYIWYNGSNIQIVG